MVIANANKAATNKDRRSQPRTTLAPLVPLATLRARVDKEHSGDFYVLHNSLCLLGYRDSYREHGYKSFKALFAHVTAQRATAISSQDLSRRLQPARTIAPEEAWESNLGPVALRIICRHPKEERAVFFALGRRIGRARSAGQRPQVPNSRALRALSAEVRAVADPAQRVALLQQRLQVRPDECVAPLVPKSELDLPRETPPPKTVIGWVNGLVGATGFIAQQIAEVRRALDGYEGPAAQEIWRKLGTVKERLGAEIIDNVNASYALAERAAAAEPARPEPRPQKKRAATTIATPPVVDPPPPPVVDPPPPPVVDPPPPPVVDPPPPPVVDPPPPPDSPPVRESAAPVVPPSAPSPAPAPSPAAEAAQAAAPSPAADSAPAAEPEPPTAADHAAPAAQVIVAGGTPPGWVRAEWLVLVAALKVLLNDDEAYRLNDLLQMLALENCHRYANHEEIRDLIDKAQQREGALPASVVPLYERWMEWVGALNVRSRHYLCVAMIVGLRRVQWRSTIYAMRTGQLPKDMRDDIRRAGNRIPRPHYDWLNPDPVIP